MRLLYLAGHLGFSILVLAIGILGVFSEIVFSKQFWDISLSGILAILLLLGGQLSTYICLKKFTGVLRYFKLKQRGGKGLRIFLSYRRVDSDIITGRIHDKLDYKLSRAKIFRDTENIPFGVDFHDHIEQRLNDCDVLLAIIGSNWQILQSDLEDVGKLDFVKFEIEGALERGIPVIPVLVKGAKIPSVESLPEGMRGLAQINAVTIRSDPDFHPDLDKLIIAIKTFETRGRS